MSFNQDFEIKITAGGRVTGKYCGMRITGFLMGKCCNLSVEREDTKRGYVTYKELRLTMIDGKPVRLDDVALLVKTLNRIHLPDGNPRPTLTPSQISTLDDFRKDILISNHGKKHVDGYEYKEFEITFFGKYKTLLLHTETGSKTDEGTMAAVFCRINHHIKIGKRGGCKLSNAREKTKPRGYYKCLHYRRGI